jgi:hypothetical protein
MSIPQKSQELLYLEEAFKDIKTNNGVDQAIRTVTRVIKRVFDLNMDVNIIDNKSHRFFGMSIYPQVNVVEQIVNEMIGKSREEGLVEMWQKNKDWVLEIDSILLHDENLNANPSEIVAVLLHEIGHIVYSNTVPQRLFKVVKRKIVTSTFKIRKLLAWKRVQRILDLVIVDACSTKNFHYVNEHTERIADRFALKMGYGESLDQFIDKLLRSQGNGMINRPDGELDSELKSMTNWALDNVGELEFRKTRLRNALQVQMFDTPSQYIRFIVKRIKSDFFGKNEANDTYKDIVTENYLITGYNNVVSEGFRELFDPKTRKLKRLSQSDMDILYIQIGRIANEDDKIYVLDIIYDYLDLVNVGLDMIQSGGKDRVPVSKETLTSYKTQLEKFRKDVLSTQVPPKKYGLFIQYPKGYES